MMYLTEDESFAALYFAIKKNLPVDRALEFIENPNSRYIKRTEEDFKEMIRLHNEGKTWVEISEKFGTSASNVCHMAKRYQRKIAKKEVNNNDKQRTDNGISSGRTTRSE